MDQLHEKYLPVLRNHSLPIILGFSGLVFLIYGLIGVKGSSEMKEDIIFESANEASADNESLNAQITIDIEGAVMKPGIYRLPSDARLQDALIKAGGLSNDADRGRVAKELNLAAKLTDSAKIYIPFLGEAVPVQSGTSLGVSTNSTESVGSLININTATESQLDTLSGVGPATAAKIISNRPYEKIEDLVTKKAVGQATFEKIKDKISVF